MPTITLTQRAVDVMKAPASGRVEYFDRVRPDGGLRIANGGRKTGSVRYRGGGGKLRETIGTLVPCLRSLSIRKGFGLIAGKARRSVPYLLRHLRFSWFNFAPNRAEGNFMCGICRWIDASRKEATDP
jgi:hypothetical protein